MTPPPPGFFARPFAHRGLHGPGRPENSLAAVRAAAEAGYGVEIDVRLAADGVAMVFHDGPLDRMTGARGPMAARTSAELAALRLAGTDAPPPTLRAALAAAGGAPMLIELKDPGAAMDATGVGPLEAAVARDLRAAPHGPVALMSFNPDSVAAAADAAPDVPRGLVAGRAADWPPGVAEHRRDGLTALEAVGRVGAAFVSLDHRRLPERRAAALRDAGLAVLCWTVTTPEQAARVAPHVDAITFEGFRP